MLAPIISVIYRFFINSYDIIICVGSCYLISLQTYIIWPYVLAPIISVRSHFYTDIYYVIICAGSSYLISLHISMLWLCVLSPVTSTIFPFTDIYDVIICVGSHYLSHISFLYRQLWCDHMCWLLLSQPYSNKLLPWNMQTSQTR